MTKLSSCTWSAVGLVLLLACGSSKSDNFGGNTTASGATPSTNVGGKSGTGISTGTSGTGATISITNGGTASTTGTVGTGSTGSGSTGSGSTGSGSTTSGTGSTGSSGAGSTTVVPTEGGAGTDDPPPATGGEGTTVDPPAGGSGNTTDPPPGDTIDPPPGDTIDPPPGDTIDPPPGDTIDPPPGDTMDPPPGCTLTDIDKVNVIVFKDMTQAGADAEGRLWVGGNLTIGPAGFSINTTTIKDLATTCAEWALVVGGNITGNINIAAGKGAYGGTFSGSFNAVCGLPRATPVDFVTLEAKFLGYSAAFKAYPTKDPSVLGTVSVTGSQVVLTGTNSTLNVFNLTPTQLTAGELKFVVPSTSSIIVNISGTTINWPGKAFILPDGVKGSCKAGTSSWCHKILYNFYEATSLKLSAIGVQGSVLAPYATVDGSSGNVDGQLVCKYLNGSSSFEYHPYYFNGCLLLPDP